MVYIAAGMDVLLVEDDPRIARVVERALTDVGHHVEVAHDGLEGLTSAERGTHDLVVLDVMLPEMDGIELARELRRQRLKTPILMLTARDAVPDRVRGLDAGADDYLTKPFSFAELFARLRALTRRDLGARPAVLVVGDLVLDPATREVRRGDADISLSAKQFAILEQFMRRPGEVLSRTDLLEHVWDFAYEGTSNLVDVYVRTLRERIDRPFGVDSIETVRGAGYRLRDEPLPATAPAGDS